MNTLTLHKTMSLFLVAAGFADACLTDLGLKTGFIHEANPIMSALYQRSIAGFYCFKIVLPILLCCLLFRRFPSRWLTGLVSASAFIYISILFLHAYWITSFVYWSLNI